MVAIDSSVIAAIVLRDPVGRKFLNILPEAETVDFAQAECLNVVWKHYHLLKRLKKLQPAMNALKEIWERIEIASTTEIRDRAMRIAVEQGITFYDAAFIALAESSGTLATLDRKQAAVAKKLGINVI